MQVEPASFTPLPSREKVGMYVCTVHTDSACSASRGVTQLIHKEDPRDPLKPTTIRRHEWFHYDKNQGLTTCRSHLHQDLLQAGDILLYWRFHLFGRGPDLVSRHPRIRAWQQRRSSSRHYSEAVSPEAHSYTQKKRRRSCPKLLPDDIGSIAQLVHLGMMVKEVLVSVILPHVPVGCT